MIIKRLAVASCDGDEKILYIGIDIGIQSWYTYDNSSSISTYEYNQASYID